MKIKGKYLQKKYGLMEEAQKNNNFVASLPIGGKCLISREWNCTIHILHLCYLFKTMFMNSSAYTSIMSSISITAVVKNNDGVRSGALNLALGANLS